MRILNFKFIYLYTGKNFLHKSFICISFWLYLSMSKIERCIEMEKLNQVMLYVDDQSKAVDFWKNTMGFAVLSEEALAEGYKAVEIAPDNEVETSISIMEKEFIKKYSPGVNLGTPSLMFKASNFDELYTKLKDMGLTGHDIIEMSGTRVFNFQDGQGNYFAVSE